MTGPRALTILLTCTFLFSLTRAACIPDQIHLSLGDLYFSASAPESVRLPNENLNSNNAYLVWNTKEQCEFTVKIVDVSNPSGELKIPVAFTREFSYDFSINNIYNYTYPGTYYSIAYTALLTGLSYNQLYEYSILDTENNIVGGPYTFRLPSPYLEEGRSKKVFFLGDIDTGIRGSKTMQRIKSEIKDRPNEYSAFCHLGDISYNLNDENGTRGDKYFNAMQDIHAKIPTIIMPGNHEWFGNWEFYNFRMRNPMYSATSNHYFSFNMEGMHFISVNFNFYMDGDSNLKQRIYSWLENDLKQANSEENRALWPWVVVASHLPIYCMFNNPFIRENRRCYSYYNDMKIWDELFHQYNVNLMISGHLHSYERMGPIYRNQSRSFTAEKGDTNHQTITDPTSTVYIIEGVGGKDGKPTGDYPVQGYGYFKDLEPGYGTLYTVKERSGVMRLVYEHYDSETGKVIDYLNLVDTKHVMLPKYNNNVLYTIFAGFVFVVLLVVLGANWVKNYRKRKQAENANLQLSPLKLKHKRYAYDDEVGIDMVDIPL